MNFINGLSDKSFISFTFDGKGVEEFGMAVVSNGDRYSINLHPNFSNTMSTVPGRIGSIYWGTEITNNTIEVNLATDCMTSRQFLNFKNHFRPGKIGLLSFAETEFCYCYAIISESSIFDFIPFDGVTTINGKDYKDTIYKGTTKLVFSISDIYSYSKSGYEYADKYLDKPWVLMSGLPFKNSILEYNCFLSNGVIANLKSDTNSAYIYAYNAGNALARANLCFTSSFSSGNDSGWADIRIGDILITKPRIFRDIDYTLSIMKAYLTNWDNNKTKILIDLRENLTSLIRGELIGIANATGTKLTWETVNEAIAAVKNIIDGKSFSFSINGIENLSIMSATLPIHIFDLNIGDPIELTFVENIGDSTNGSYITIEPSSGIKEDGKVDILKIAITANSFDNVKLYFLNTYLV